MSQQQQQLVMLVMLVIIITHTPCACLDAFSFSADRVVLASFLIGTAFARSLALFCIVRCGAMMMMMMRQGRTRTRQCLSIIANCWRLQTSLVVDDVLRSDSV